MEYHLHKETQNNCVSLIKTKTFIHLNNTKFNFFIFLVNKQNTSGLRNGNTLSVK